ncbi:STAS domain-containing protein [Labilibaculum sp. DW002]|uniref:STAS domain-containing protein n=1 Tax=Paralabilibaculum antarcticum TaxID=2912572 RepID=A0ABT5VZ84_9BACT|nr:MULTISPECIES: STAS domain-containing protein [unclassified Labilibaculum]MBI9059588.1 STAS domain-containing protein [Labilibaculum sp.]MDE5420132.1 STAS domain-containing protein [Labilibaculum sp. DW002]|eukprot:TRINITY_DN12475_c0_g3_i1.p1 TRINITY_DN12475_c0_g3~~TRINITY_DN12475_c0_g3_i1.p1  ORF type:complete len:120 (-),score=5.73 TRINITY_DN12475_c0_g3_i1:111-422(-)
MLNYQVKEQSVIASLEGVKRINAKISDLVKKEINEFIEKSGQQVVLDLRGVSFIDSEGFSALQAIAEFARVNNQIFSYMNVSEDVMELIELVGMKESFVIFKN